MFFYPWCCVDVIGVTESERILKIAIIVSKISTWKIITKYLIYEVLVKDFLWMNWFSLIQWHWWYELFLGISCCRWSWPAHGTWYYKWPLLDLTLDQKYCWSRKQLDWFIKIGPTWRVTIARNNFQKILSPRHSFSFILLFKNLLTYVWQNTSSCVEGNGFIVC